MGHSVYLTSTVEVRRYNSRSTSYALVEHLDLSSPLPALVALCKEPDNMVKAASMAQRLALAKAAHLPVVNYVITPRENPEICKIGWTNNPLSRLCGLQIGNWNHLEIAALVWSSKASEIERLALQAAAEMEVRVRGEWLAMNPDEACELLLKAARYAKAKAIDSAGQLRNFAARTHAVAQTKPQLKAA